MEMNLTTEWKNVIVALFYSIHFDESKLSVRQSSKSMLCSSESCSILRQIQIIHCCEIDLSGLFKWIGTEKSLSNSSLGHNSENVNFEGISIVFDSWDTFSSLQLFSLNLQTFESKWSEMVGKLKGSFNF